MSLFEELKRRRVFRVVISYAITAWLVLQVADIATESFDAPGWVMQMLFTVLVLGFFLAIVLAWVFQLAGGQVVRDRGEETDAATQGSDDGAGQRGLIVVLALALVLSGVLLWDRFTSGEDTRVAVQPVVSEASVAVLPFTNMSASEENAYFSDGLTDTLLHQLAQVSELKVAARTSSFAFKDSNTDIREIAAALDVAHVLEGSVQRAGNTVRITAQLIQASDGYHLWSGTFDRDLNDIFVMQDEIAAQVASALTGALLETTADAVRVDGGTDNPEAYDLYLQSREAYFEGTERSLTRSNRLLRQAVTLDPNFGIAWSYLAESIMRHGILAGLSWDDIVTEMGAAADRGLELAPENSIALAIKGMTVAALGHNTEGRAYLERALEADPNNVWALSYLADIQFSQNEFSAAVESAGKAMSLDPLDFTLKAQSTSKYLQVGDIEAARALAQAALERSPGSFDGLAALGNIYWRSGDYGEAYRIYYELVQNHPNTYYIYGRISGIFEDLGDFATAERWIERSMEINEERGKINMGYFCAQIKRTECATMLLREAMIDWDPADDEEQGWLLSANSTLAVLGKDWEQLYDVTEAQIDYWKECGRMFSVSWARTNKALAAKRLGRMDELQRLSEQVDAFIADSLANGGNSQYQHLWLAYSLVLRDDVAGATNSLRAAIEKGFRAMPKLQNDDEWDDIRNTPEFRAVVDDLAIINAAELERVQASVAEIWGV